MQPASTLARVVIGLAVGAAALMAGNLKSAVSSPEAASIIEKDLLPAPKTYAMPKGCVSTDPKRIANGKLFFHNLNSDKAKVKTEGGKTKQFGNCIACHRIEEGKGYGNIGPDLRNYKAYFVDSGVRKPEWVYQKIADTRIDNPTSNMTVNLTSGIMNEREVCDIVSYIISAK